MTSSARPPVSLKCPVCSYFHENVEGTQIFVEANCPICFETCSPIVVIKCKHGFCKDCFNRLKLMAARPPNHFTPLPTLRSERRIFRALRPPRGNPPPSPPQCDQLHLSTSTDPPLSHLPLIQTVPWVATNETPERRIRRRLNEGARPTGVVSNINYSVPLMTSRLPDSGPGRHIDARGFAMGIDDEKFSRPKQDEDGGPYFRKGRHSKSMMNRHSFVWYQHDMEHWRFCSAVWYVWVLLELGKRESFSVDVVV